MHRILVLKDSHSCSSLVRYVIPMRPHRICMLKFILFALIGLFGVTVIENVAGQIFGPFSPNGDMSLWNPLKAWFYESDSPKWHTFGYI